MREREAHEAGVAGGDEAVDAERAAGRRAARPRRRPWRERAADWEERLIAGVPARIMRPRLVFLGCLAALLGFGLVMVYSASSVEALQEEGSSSYYLLRQAAFVAVGLVVAFLLCSERLPWEVFRSQLVQAAWIAVCVALVLVLIIGSSSGGATRWISLGFISLQPSEFAKPVIILMVADLLARYYEERSLDTASMGFLLLAMVGVPLTLIIIEPDLGTTIIIIVTVFALFFLAGISAKLTWSLIVAIFVFALLAIVTSSYRMERLSVILDPWSDPYGDGYQATLAIMAFASGGLFGRGIGNSVMKYNYLPEAHNDYILAIIGEEVGFVGTIIFLVVYLAMIFAALSIAEQAPTLHAKLVASGCGVILGVQAAVNVLGILSILPMTGKPLPFISYGGSSMVSSLIMAALVVRVSKESEAAFELERSRSGLAVMSEQDAVSSHLGRSTAGVPRTRNATLAGERQRPTFRVYDGGERAADGELRGRARAEDGDWAERRRDGAPPGGWQRVDLSDVSPVDRLRNRSDGTDHRDGGDVGA